MFGSKKETVPLAPFNLRVLTEHHVIEGTVPGDARVIFSGFVQFMNQADRISGVTITSIDSKQSAQRTCDSFGVFMANAAILIPDADPTRMPYWGSYECFTDPYKGTFHVGPYLVSGTLMSMPGGRTDDTFVAIDVHISTLNEGPDCAQIAAPFALVRSGAIFGWEEA